MLNDPNGGLHLASLSIRGFQGIRELDIPRLGRVTLLAGKNGVGKTAVTEAVQLYASRGQDGVISDLVSRREEFAVATDEDGKRLFAPIPVALLHGREISSDSRIEIGSTDSANDQRLVIEATAPSKNVRSYLSRYFPEIARDGHSLTLEVSFANRKRKMPWVFSRYIGDGKTGRMKGVQVDPRFFYDEQELPSELPCRSLGPGLPQSNEVADLWDDIALTEDDSRAVRALNLILDGKADRAATIGEPSPRYGRRVVVKLRDRDRPVPLRSLGDGATRLFGVALALAGSRDGFLVIDEAENGIHHSVHDALWRMVLRTAEENNVQVFATTHSFDCVRGFARAAKDSPESEGVLVRLEKAGERTRAVTYSEEDLETVVEQHIEVR